MGATTYLQPTDYQNYGCPSATDDQVARASRVVDSYCGRAKWGFVYNLDANGNPAYMASAVPDVTFTATATINPGANVVVTLASGQVVVDLIGKTVTLDAGTPAKTEVCTITSLTVNPNTITLGNVQFQHIASGSNPGPQMVGGLQIFESRYVDARRAFVRIAQFPVVNLISGAGRIEYGRRSDQIQGSYYDNSILAMFATANWGSAPPWLIFDTTQCGVNVATGELWVPVSVYLLRYSEVRLWYAAGYTSAALPDAIKQATANIVRRYGSLVGTPFMDSTFQKMAAGDTSLTRFKDVAIDAETAGLLEPFRANQFY